MPLFSYTAINAENQRVSGTVEAMSLQAARDALKEMRLVPEEIHESLPPAPAAIPDDAAARFADVSATEPSPAASPPPPPASTDERTYFPLLDTLRLYAGWLLAWYGFVYALGSYQHFRRLPFTVPYVEGLFLSPLVLSFTLGAFLFLLLTGIWKAISRGILSGCILTILGIAVFVLYRMNVV